MTFIKKLSGKGAALLAGLVLVGSGFAAAPAHAANQTDQQLRDEIAQLTAEVQALLAQLGGGTTGTCSFSRDLGYGVSGSDVTCLQTYLISSGYSIPAGATGYFGAQSQAAVAIWQAAHGVVPANGYFSATSRAEYSALISGNNGGNGGNGGNGNGNDNLNGGPADLTAFDLEKGDDATDLEEDHSGQELAEIRFRPRDGDVEVNSIDMRFAAQDDDKTSTPWTYFDTLKIYDGSKLLDSEDVGSKSDWDQVGNGDTYTMTFKHLSDKIDEDDTAELTVKATTQDNINDNNTDQSFKISVPDKGLSATDGKNKTQTTGDTSDTVTLEFNS